MSQGEKGSAEALGSGVLRGHRAHSGTFRRAEPRGRTEPADGARDSVIPSQPPEQCASAWSHCTKAYDVFADGVTRPFAEDAVRLVYMRPGSRVLDVAAGTGAFTLAAAARGADVLATDFSPEMIEELGRKCRELGLNNVSTAVMDGQALELQDESFDVAASLFGLMFFPDPDRGLRELLRVLKPGGQAVVGTWAPPARVELMRLVGDAAMSAMLDLPASDPPYWMDLCDARTLRKRLLAIGFAKVHVVSLTHVCTFEEPEQLAELLQEATPSSSALFVAMTAEQRELFVRALVEGFRERQGNGPFAVTSEGLIAVGTKAR